MSSKNNSSSIFGIVLILALLGLNAYQWMTSSKLKSDLSSQKSEFLNLEKINTELDFNYQTKLEELEGLRGDNEELNSRIDAQKLELAAQKKKISGLIWTQKELGKAKDEMERLNQLANEYIAETTKLKEENDILQGKNAKLTQQNTSLTEEVQVNMKKISNLDSVKTILVSQTEELSATNTTLSGKVEIAEAIKINAINVKGYEVKDDGSLKEKGKAKKVKMLRACLTTETNIVTPAGETEFYVTYTNPIGEVMYLEEAGSGSLTEKLNGETVKYTISGTTEYKNADHVTCIDFKPNFKLISGIYKVNVYNHGFEVGKGEFKLK